MFFITLLIISSVKAHSIVTDNVMDKTILKFLLNQDILMKLILTGNNADSQQSLALHEGLGGKENANETKTLLKEILNLVISLRNKQAEIRGTLQDGLANLKETVSIQSEEMKKLRDKLEFTSITTSSPEPENSSQDSRSGGVVPLTPIAFTALLSGDGLQYDAGDTVIYSYIRVNVGNHYNSSTGIFTAPTAGVYFFTWSTLTSPGVGLNTAIVKNSSSGYIAFCHCAAFQNTYTTCSQSTTVELVPGDRIWIIAYKMSAQKLHGGTWPAFSGFKL
ncbi:complement C1q-like protein 4 [Saccostrea cucullata]|uniref:complement C1q-like protein 4 n=1 Tax=Saccostrea cuccullata TaxID=36930 RepID=UPI002ED64054